MSWIKQESKEAWHTAKPLTKKWHEEESKESWHTCKPLTKCWEKQEKKEHNLKSLGLTIRR